MPEPKERRDSSWSERMHAAKAAKRAAEKAAGIDGLTAGLGAASKPIVERDRSLSLRTAREIARDTKARDADRLTAAALLARIEEVQSTERPPSIVALEALSNDDLERIVLAHL